MTKEELDELRRLEREAFCAPWKYSEWEVECPTCEAQEVDCTNPECDGSHVPCTTIESPDEYPGGQVVAQFSVPGISSLADKNGAFIVALRNAAPQLIAAAERCAEWDAWAAAHGERALEALTFDSSGIAVALRALLHPEKPR